jgi:hypothetical protein
MKKPDSVLKLYDSENDESGDDSSRTNSTVNSKEASASVEASEQAKKANARRIGGQSTAADFTEDDPDDAMDPLALFERDTDVQRRRQQASPSRRASATDVTLVGRRVRQGDREGSPEPAVRLVRSDSVTFEADLPSTVSASDSFGSNPAEKRRVRFSLADSEASATQFAAAAAAVAPAPSAQPLPAASSFSSSSAIAGSSSSRDRRPPPVAVPSSSAAAASPAAAGNRSAGAQRAAPGGGESYMARVARALARSMPCTSPRVAG